MKQPRDYRPADAGGGVGVPLLEMAGIGKSFPGVVALDGARLDVRAGEVHALMGENGAGKSTLIRILAGAQPADAGTIRVDGRVVRFRSPRDAERAGVAVLYQEFNLVPTLSARENLYLAKRPGGGVGRVLWPGRERRAAADVFRRLGLDIDPDARCDALTVAQQQGVEIAKAVTADARVLVMDEPTAALTHRETANLFRLIADLKSRGVGIVYVSHRMDEVFRLADRVTVLRDGRWVATAPAAGLTRGRLIELMVGRPLDAEFPPRRAGFGPDRLTVTGLRRGTAVRGVSLSVRRGEVVGLTGLVGAGRTEVARLIFGADRRDGGTIAVDGRVVQIATPADAIRLGICLITEDRKAQGLVLGQSCRANFGLPNLRRFSVGWFVSRWRERRAFGEYIDTLRIKIPTQEVRAGNLSGGNQQKLVLAKWLARDSDVVLFDEPTRGIDVGAKHEIYRLIDRLAAAGKAVLMISSELPEVLGMSDRVLVMREGRIVGEIADVAAATQEQVLALAMR